MLRRGVRESFVLARGTQTQRHYAQDAALFAPGCYCCMCGALVGRLKVCPHPPFAFQHTQPLHTLVTPGR